MSLCSGPIGQPVRRRTLPSELALLASLHSGRLGSQRGMGAVIVRDRTTVSEGMCPRDASAAKAERLEVGKWKGSQLVK